MRPKDIIYQAGKSGTHGELILVLPRLLKMAYHLLRTAGGAMVAFAILVFMFSYGPIISQELAFNYKSMTGNKTENSSELESQARDYSVEIAQANEVLAVQKEANSHGLTSYFSLVIPRIDAKANIIANVDTADKEEYSDALSRGIAHARGTNFPGQAGRVFLFSHSTDSPINFTRYNAIFYLLRKLEAGDEIVVFFADKKYVYVVTQKHVVKPADTSWIMPKLGEEELVLMTCDPPGTTWNRLLVVAKPISN